MTNKILNTKNILALSVFAATAVTSVNVMAEQVTVPVTASVRNTFSLENKADLDFGEIRATGHSVSVATYTISPEPGVKAVPGNTTGTEASIQELTAGSPAVFKITQIPPFAAINLTLPTDAEAALLEVKSGSTSSNKFVLGHFSVYSTTEAKDIPIDNTTGKGVVKAKDVGEIDFSVGSVLTTVASATKAAYEDGAYTGSFKVIANY